MESPVFRWGRALVIGSSTVYRYIGTVGTSVVIVTCNRRYCVTKFASTVWEDTPSVVNILLPRLAVQGPEKCPWCCTVILPGLFSPCLSINFNSKPAGGQIVHRKW